MCQNAAKGKIYEARRREKSERELEHKEEVKNVCQQVLGSSTSSAISRPFQDEAFSCGHPSLSDVGVLHLAL